MVAVRPTDGDLIAHLKAVQIARQAAAFFDAELLILLICRRGGDGKHSLAYTRLTQHRALARHMLKQLAALRRVDTECLYIRRLLPDVCDDADLRDQRIQTVVFMTCTFTHSFSLPALQML